MFSQKVGSLVSHLQDCIGDSVATLTLRLESVATVLRQNLQYNLVAKDL
jgi:hypothetical protein